MENIYIKFFYEKLIGEFSSSDKIKFDFVRLVYFGLR